MSGLLRLSLLALASSSLAGCDSGPRMWSHDEIEEISSTVAYDAVGEMTGNYETADYSAQIADLESRIESQEIEIDSLESDLDYLRAELDAHSHY